MCNNTNTSLYCNTTNDSQQYPEQEVAVPIIVIYIVVIFRLVWGVFAIFGNGLTIATVFRFHKLQRCTNYFICSLAAADLLCGLATPAMAFHKLFPDHFSFVQVCLIERTITLISSHVNVFSILWIAVDRCIFIAYPLRYPFFVTPTSAFVVIALTWAYLCVATPLVIYLTNHLDFGIECKYSEFLPSVIFNFYLTPQLVLCIVLTIGIYIVIAKIAYKQKRKIAAENLPYDTLEATTFKRQNKISKMMFTVMASYFITWFPLTVFLIILRTNNTVVMRCIENGAYILFFSNTWINPIIYAWKSKDFRKAFLILLGRNGNDNSLQESAV